MEEMLNLLRDGHARTIQMLAAELDTSPDDIERKLEYLENTGVIRRVLFQKGKCKSCPGCHADGKRDAAMCAGCMPEGGFKNMGEMWEVVTGQGDLHFA